MFKPARRAVLAAIAAAALLCPAMAFAADALKEIRIDWATYNPVSMMLKQKGAAGKGIRQGRHQRRLGADGRFQQGAGIPQRRLDRFRLDRRLRGAGRQDQRQSDQVDLCLFAAGMDGAGDQQGFADRRRSTDLKGKRVAVTRGTDPHIFLVRALLRRGMTEKDITPVLLQHADGKTALIRGDVDAWAGLDPMMAQAEIEDGARLFFRKPDANTWGILNVREAVPEGLSGDRRSACSRCTRRRANIRSPITTS